MDFVMFVVALVAAAWLVDRFALGGKFWNMIFGGDNNETK